MYQAVMRFPWIGVLGMGVDYREIFVILFGSLRNFTISTTELSVALATRITIGRFTRTYSKCNLEEWA